MTTRPREFRPYRVTMYAIFAVFTFLFIGLVFRSVWTDLYDRKPARGDAMKHPSLTVCADELESLFRHLSVRTGMSTELTPEAERDWNTFSRNFEDRLTTLRSRCVDAPGNEDARLAIRDAVDRLDSLRQHLSRCGEEGENERKLVVQSIDRLRETRRLTGH